MSRKRAPKHEKHRTAKTANQVYLNFLRYAKPTARIEVIRTAPHSVIKSICNAAVNAAYNPRVRLSPAQRKVLGRYRQQIGVLTSRAYNLRKKRHTLQTGGVLPFLPVLIGSALATLGAHIFAK